MTESVKNNNYNYDDRDKISGRPPMFDGENFDYWKDRIESFFLAYDIDPGIWQHSSQRDQSPFTHSKVRSAQKEEDGTVETVFSRFQILIAGLKVLHKGYSTADHVKKIIRSLPKKWRPMFTALKLAKNLNAISLEELIISLRSHEKELEEDEPQKKEMRKFLVPRTSIENVNVVQPEAKVEETPPNVANEFNPNEIVRDLGCRKKIHEYATDIQDQVRRAYILKGPTQPDLAIFPRTQSVKSSRAFCKAWYKNYTWIEYSESKDAAYCFYCFLVKPPGRAEHFGYEVFNKDGFKDWKHASKGFKDHIGSHNSNHNSCMKHYDDYNNQRQSVTSIFARATRESEELYKIRLTCSLDCIRYLIAQGIAFRGHDESYNSLNKGNFREMVDWVKSNDEKVRDAFGRGPKNCTMTSGDIQKELATCCAHEVTKVIMEELGERQIFVLIDESRDISVKEQMAVMLRILNDKGKVVERFIALHHVKYTTSEAQKDALYGILDRHTLCISRIRGQGYDGTSNMRGEFNGLQRKILDKNPYAFYVHCYAHRLQLVVVSVASSCSSIHDFFEYISLIVTTTSASCKRRDALTEAQHQYILNRLESGEIS
ncbi:uncharacterized protein LOC131631618 [Vicia villosa]|uniref:uncharacterized protein LOC131631618 n=1 Tax=Vicia villosa TaxID=3911 RepID=UPI00273B5E9F|nr:uncharacterized protein LOC131631618 [Vicia villosa]